jgi:hypothetical protein
MRSDLKADLRELELRIERQIERILIVRLETPSSHSHCYLPRAHDGSVHNSFPAAKGPD